MEGIQLSQGYRATTRRHFYFFSQSPQEFLIPILLTSEGRKDELTLEPPSGFELGTPGLGVECLNL